MSFAVDLDLGSHGPFHRFQFLLPLPVLVPLIPGITLANDFHASSLRPLKNLGEPILIFEKTFNGFILIVTHPSSRFLIIACNTMAMGRPRSRQTLLRSTPDKISKGPGPRAERIVILIVFERKQRRATSRVGSGTRRAHHGNATRCSRIPRSVPAGCLTRW